jgi:IS1 family transposase
MLAVVGAHCDQLFTERIQNVSVHDVQCDEIWGYVQKKEGHKWPWEKYVPTIGDAYCFVAIERDTKLVLAWHLGRRTDADTDIMSEKLRVATKGRFQITTDGFKPYLKAIPASLGERTDFAQLVKDFKTSKEGERRYSPPNMTFILPKVIHGDPDPDRICTSHIERQNLTIRMSMRRMTRLTNAFSKKWENLYAAYALHFAYYNFCRVHQTLKKTPTMASGLTDHVWSIGELLTAEA